MDPKTIIEDAMNPNVSASDVLNRARMVSKTGHLLQVVQEKLAQRGGAGAA